MIKALFLIYLIWGFNWVVMKLAMDYFSPVTFVTYRFLSGAIVLLLVSFIFKHSLPQKKFLPWIFISGAFQIALNSIIVQMCIQSLGAGFSAVLNYTMPIWVAIMAQFFLNEKLTRQKMIGIIISIIGLAILMNIDITGSVYYIILALIGAFSWAVSNIIFKLKLAGCDMIVFNTWQMTVGAIILIIVSLATNQDIGQWTPISALYVLYNGVLASALAFFLWSYVLKNMEAGKASVAILAVPIVGVICGIIFLNEPVTLFGVIGIIMILAGVFTVMKN